jgi:large subunit ribosomal protein L5
MAEEKKEKTEETKPEEAEAAEEKAEAKAEDKPKAEARKASKKKAKDESPKAEGEKPEGEKGEKKKARDESSKADGKKPEGEKGEKKGKKKADAKKDKEEKAEPKPFVQLTPPRMLMLFREKVIPQMLKEFSWSNPNRVPRIDHVTINIGIGEGSRDIKQIEASIEDIRVITGQQPVITRARKSVAQYKLRAGMPVGLKVTLRGRRMWHFLDKLFNLAMPRVRDFQGLNPNSFDGRGNFTMGLKEQLVFPEIDYDKVARVRGMDITIVTSARNDVEAAHLLRGLGCPLRP